MIATARVKNVSGHNVREDFPFYGTVEIAAGEIKRIPEDVVQAWEDRDRNNGKVLVERLEDSEADPAPAPKGKGGRKPKAEAVVPVEDEISDLTDEE
jgi:hypothetical protein